MSNNHNFLKRWNKSYALVMALGIFAILLIFIVVYNLWEVGLMAFMYFIVSGIVTSVMIWLGSRYISIVCIKSIDVFIYPARFILVLASSLIVYSGSIVFIEIKITEWILHISIEQTLKITSIIISVLITLFITTIHTSYYFFINWKENLLEAEKLEKATLQAQYETLKNQVNPHFVFNSLNTLLTMVECNPAAVKYVESLSDFLRYVLQTRDKEAVLLRDELSMAKQYTNIQKGRFGDKLKITTDVPESYYHYAIPPLVLQMLLENAIKHNVISKDNVLEISIYIDEKKYLVVENKIHLKEDIETSTGIGLNNIKSRYLFLSGKDVMINEDDGIFRVKLPLIEYKL